MKRRHLRESHFEHPNVVPLIDVMLCIIVFYMLAARIGVDSGADQAIRLPVTALGTDLEKIGTNNLIINVREDNGGEPLVTARVDGGDGSGGVQVFTVGKAVDAKGRAPLRDVLRALRIGRDGRENSADDRPDLGVIVRGDGEMTYKTFMPVMLAIAEAGVRNVYHNTKKDEGRGARGEGQGVAGP